MWALGLLVYSGKVHPRRRTPPDGGVRKCDGLEGGRRPWPCNSGYPEQDTAKIMHVGHTENEVYRSSQNEIH